MSVLPIVDRLLTSPGNVNSSYSYVNRLSVDFFPQHRISTEGGIIDEALRLDAFYKNRTLRIRDVDQLDLFQ